MAASMHAARKRSQGNGNAKKAQKVAAWKDKFQREDSTEMEEKSEDEQPLGVHFRLLRLSWRVAGWKRKQ